MDLSAQSPHSAQGAPSCPPGDNKSNKSKSPKSAALSSEGASQRRNQQRSKNSKQAPRGNDGVHLLNFQYPQTPPPRGSGGGGAAPASGGRQRKNPSHPHPKLKLKAESRPSASRHSNQGYVSSRWPSLSPPSHLLLASNSLSVTLPQAPPNPGCWILTARSPGAMWSL